MRCSLTLALALLLPPLAVAQISEGDRHWNQRAEGSRGGRALSGPIDAALAAYRQAIAQNPNDLEARWKLLRAYRFKGAYVAQTTDEKKRIYAEAKRAGEDAVALLERVLQSRGVSSIARASEKQVAAAARQVAGAGEILLWDAVNWGEWALAYGKVAAARQGAADRILRQAGMALLIDPRLEGGTPARVLGRLHDQTPRIPFITGWASQEKAVRYLQDSLKIDPRNKITMVFLAEAMVAQSSDNKAQAVRMLRNAIAMSGDPEYAVEQAAAQAEAEALLKKWEGSGP